MGLNAIGQGGSPPNDLVIVEGINAHGFGTVSKAVMRDVGLPVEAKGMYAYLCSFAGGGQTAFPSRATMLAELGMSKDRFYKYRQMLVERGLLRIERKSEGKVAHPVRTNIYILASEMPACYRKPTEAAPQSGPVCPVENKSETPSCQVETDVLETRTSVSGFPQSAGQKQCTENKDVLETRTTTRPEIKDIGKKGPPSSNAENGEGINNNVRIDVHPSIHPGAYPDEVERDFAELSSPQRTPNRNRIREALAPYAELRSLFPAAVIDAAWKRRQRDARESGRQARFYPQLARWLEDPGPDGAALMCESEVARQKSRLTTKVSVALSLDEGYMALREEASSLKEAARSGTASPSDAAKLDALESAMTAIRASKTAEMAATSSGA